jgi:hypothetical protein
LSREAGDVLVDATAQMATGVEGLLCVAETQLAVNDSHRIQFAVQELAPDLVMTGTDGGRASSGLCTGASPNIVRKLPSGQCC